MKGDLTMSEETFCRGFESDNCSGVHERVIEAIIKANTGHCIGYGYDAYTQKAIKEFEKIFGEDISVYLTMNGTGTNAASLAHLVHQGQAIVCAQGAHIASLETGAVERMSGARIIEIPADGGKIEPEALEEVLGGWQSEHTPQIHALSITQCTESGRVYSPCQVKRLCDIAHSHGVLVHMDGARIANAAASCQDDIVGMTKDAGVDVLCFGGTKNGLLYGEAVVFFEKALGMGFKGTRKSCGQLSSKMRFISAQFEAVLKDGLWLSMAHHSNDMAEYMWQQMMDCTLFRPYAKPDANELFAFVDDDIRDELRKRFSFMDVGPVSGISRFVCSFDTTRDDIDDFIAYAKKLKR